MQENWFIFSDSFHKGPYSSDEIINLLDLQKVSPHAYAWKHGLKSWKKIAEIHDFKDNTIAIKRVHTKPVILPTKKPLQTQAPIVKEKKADLSESMGRIIRVYHDQNGQPEKEVEFNANQWQVHKGWEQGPLTHDFEEEAESKAFASYQESDFADFYLRRQQQPPPLPNKQILGDFQLLKSPFPKLNNMGLFSKCDLQFVQGRWVLKWRHFVWEKAIPQNIFWPVETKIEIEAKQTNNKKFVLICVSLGILALSIWAIQLNMRPPFERPVGINDKIYNQFLTIVKTPPVEKLAIEMAFDQKKSTLWFASNFEFYSNLYLDISSVPGKVLTEDNIKFESTAPYQNNLAAFKVFKNIEGSRFYPGYYKVKIRGRDASNKLWYFPWITQSVSNELNYETTIYWGEESEENFLDQLKIYRTNLRKNELLHFQELMQKNKTMLSILNQLESDFYQTLEKIKLGRQIETFEKNYTTQTGIILRELTIDSKMKQEKLKAEFKDIIAAYEKSVGSGIGLGELGHDMIFKIKKKKIITVEDKKIFKNNFSAKAKELRDELQMAGQQIESATAKLEQF